MYNRSCLYLHRPRYRQYTHVEQYSTDSGQPLHNGNAHAPDDRSLSKSFHRGSTYFTSPHHLARDSTGPAMVFDIYDYFVMS